jgi:hypothetical protein
MGRMMGQKDSAVNKIGSAVFFRRIIGATDAGIRTNSQERRPCPIVPDILPRSGT